MKKQRLLLFDSTLRDGSHALGQQWRAGTVEAYCRKVDAARLEVVMVGHGNGLGASSLQTGLSLLSDEEMLSLARRNLRKTKMGAFLIPGYGTIRDDIKPAIELGVDLFCVAAHCTEADVTRQHIEYVQNHGKEAYGILMMYHMTDTARLVQEALKMQLYGAQGVIVMDSAGASTPQMVQQTILALKQALDVRVGFHSHNNLGLAVGNACAAYQSGADIIDGTVRGLGAGAGNCQLEALVAVLQKEGVDTGVDLFTLLDASENVIAPIMPQASSAVSALSIISGMSGVFSSFSTHVRNVARQFGVNPIDIFIELGHRKAVGGQEDMVVHVAMDLAQRGKGGGRHQYTASLA